MHKDLSKQVHAKQELRNQMKEADKNGYLAGLKLIDNRMAQAEIIRTHLGQTIKKGINQSRDYHFTK